MAPPPLKNPTLYHIPLLLLLIPTALSTPSTASYSAHCGAPSSAPDLAGDNPQIGPAPHLQLPSGYFSGGGDRIFGPESSSLSRSFSFLPTSVRHTTNSSIFHVTASLTLFGGRRRLAFPGRHLLGGRLHRVRPRLPRLIGRRASVTFDLDGYYSSASANLCMVGSGSGRDANGLAAVLPGAVLRFHLPNISNLSQPFVTGRLESIASPVNFEPASLVAYAEEGYAYTENTSCPQASQSALRLSHWNSICFYPKHLLKTSFRLEYRDGSEARNSSLQLHERYMYINQMRCTDDGFVRVYMVFSNQTEPWTHNFVVGEEAVVAEGFWDRKMSRLCLNGCHVVNSGPSRVDLAVGKCGIGLSLWFQAMWSLSDRSFAAGLVWNAGLKSDEGTEGRSSVILVSSIGNFRGVISGLKYKYTRVDEAKRYYLKAGLNKKRRGKFPDSNSHWDFAFQFFLQKENGSGYASPITIGSVVFNGNLLMPADPFSYHAMAKTKQRLLDVSYDIQYGESWPLATFKQQISAEGVYDTNTGSLCMVACRGVNGSSDCEVLVTAQFASLDDVKARERVKGTISSLRSKSDPLFFEPLDIASYGMYTKHVDESIWRMDLESTMVLVSMTLSCIFIVVQLFHVKRNPEVLPAMSITMLFVLTLGYMIPLVLNFEALFMSRNKQTVQLSSGGWLEVNEVMLRIITMIAFLLQLHLLHLAWSGRSVDGSKDESWAAERKALWICLPLYFLGGVVTCIVHMVSNNARRRLLQVATTITPVGPTFWEDLVSYGGLILDGFLLPQVILNALSDSKVRALAPGFYIGSTLIRALPHVYDAFRANHFVPSLRPSYIYANPRDDLFSLAWDIVIPCGAILLSVFLFFQQRLGGAFFLCSKNRKSSEYEMVSTVSS